MSTKNQKNVKNGEMLERAKAQLKANGYSYRSAAPLLGVRFEHLCLVLTGVRQSRRLLDAIAALPACPANKMGNVTVADAKPSMAERMVRVRHIASGRYLVVDESCRVYSQDDPAPEYKLTWGPVQVASALLESTARAVSAAWICLADDASVEIEEVEA